MRVPSPARPVTQVSDEAPHQHGTGLSNGQTVGQSLKCPITGNRILAILVSRNGAIPHIRRVRCCLSARDAAASQVRGPENLHAAHRGVMTNFLLNLVLGTL